MSRRIRAISIVTTVDNFKRINNACRRATGDEALRRMSDAMRQSIRHAVGGVFLGRHFSSPATISVGLTVLVGTAD